MAKTQAIHAENPSFALETLVKHRPLVIIKAPGQRCSATCQCACHAFHRLSNPTWAIPIFGTLLGSVTRFPNPKCSQKSCNSQSRFSASLVYFFPHWMPAWLHLRTFYLFISRDRSDSVYFNLRFSRVVDSDHPSMHCAVSGDIHGLIVLFQSGESAPVDVDKNGNSLLHVSGFIHGTDIFDLATRSRLGKGT